MPIFIGRETENHILPTKINEHKFAKVSLSNKNFSFRINEPFINNNNNIAEVGFRWDPDAFAWVRPGLPLLSNLAGHRKSATAGSLDGRGWRELKVLPVSWFDEQARILTLVEDTGVWPDGLLDAYIAMIPKTDGDATPLGQRPLCVLPVVYRIFGPLLVWCSLKVGLSLGFLIRFYSAGNGRGSVEAWYTTALDIEEVLSGVADSHVHLFVADVIESFDTVDRKILDSLF